MIGLPDWSILLELGWQNSTDDTVTPIAGTRNLDTKLKILYADAPEMIDRIAEWFKKFL
jgi:hypothetical protein